MIIKAMPYSKEFLQSEEGKKWKSNVDKRYRENNKEQIIDFYR